MKALDVNKIHKKHCYKCLFNPYPLRLSVYVAVPSAESKTGTDFFINALTTRNSYHIYPGVKNNIHL